MNEKEGTFKVIALPYVGYIWSDKLREEIHGKLVNAGFTEDDFKKYGVINESDGNGNYVIKALKYDCNA